MNLPKVDAAIKVLKEFQAIADELDNTTDVAAVNAISKRLTSKFTEAQVRCKDIARELAPIVTRKRAQANVDAGAAAVAALKATKAEPKVEVKVEEDPVVVEEKPVAKKTTKKKAAKK